MNDKSLSSLFFKYRSYTPVPFIVIMLIYENANIWSLIAGVLIVIIGESIRLWGVSWAGSETRTTDKPGGTYLIMSGPFAYLRNPLYLGNILIYFFFRASFLYFPPPLSPWKIYYFFLLKNFFFLKFPRPGK